MRKNTLGLASPLRLAGLGAIALLGASIAGCATGGASSSTEWAPGKPHGGPYSKVLVVGVTASVNSRCQYENFLADQLSSPSTQVIQSCSLETPAQPPTKESVAKMAISSGADAVLATRMVGASSKVGNDGSRDDRGGDYWKAEGVTDVWGPWGFDDIPAVYGAYTDLPELSFTEGQVSVSSKVYSVQAKGLVCTINTTVKGLDTTESSVAAVAEAVADKMRSDGLAK